MITIVKYTDRLKDQWNAFIDTSRNGIFMFNRNYMDYHSDRFIDNSLMFYDGSKLVAVLPANIVSDRLFSHQGLTFGGLIYSFKTTLECIIECIGVLVSYMRNNKISSLLYKKIPHTYSRYPSDDDLYALYRHNAKLLKVEPSSCVDLRLPINFSKLRKRQIAKAEKFNVQVTGSCDFDAFICLQNEVLRQRHNTKAVHSAQEMQLLHSCFPQNIKLITSYYKDALVAGSVLFIYDNIVHTQYLAANDVGREVGGLDILLYSQIEFYKKTFITYFDFGISTEDNGNFLNSGLTRQKESFGARTIVHNTFILEA